MDTERLDSKQISQFIGREGDSVVRSVHIFTPQRPGLRSGVEVATGVRMETSTN
jgi:hypothetical protein